MTQEITVVAVDKSKPGFLKRRKEFMALQRRIAANDETAIDDLVEFVLKNATVTGPEGADLHEAIMELSEEDYTALFNSDSVKPTKGG
jgi:hypothetical protein